jgi:hypothetical protein
LRTEDARLSEYNTSEVPFAPQFDAAAQYAERFDFPHSAMAINDPADEQPS